MEEVNNIEIEQNSKLDLNKLNSHEKILCLAILGLYLILIQMKIRKTYKFINRYFR